jgi:hypothetical protein
MVDIKNRDIVFHHQYRWFGIVCLMVISGLFIFLISDIFMDHTDQEDIFSGWIAFFLGSMITASFILLTPGKMVVRDDSVELYPTLLERILRSSDIEMIEIKDIITVRTDINDIIIKVENKNGGSFIQSTSSSTKAKKIRRMIYDRVSAIKK